MTGLQWLVLFAVAVLSATFAFWTYLRREVPVRGRRLLASVRSLVLTLVVLLLVNPSVPGGLGTRQARTWVALDASLSMNAAPAGEATPWEGGVARARALRAGGDLVATFGDRSRFAAEDPALLDAEPTAPTSMLAPLLERAIEAGATEVIVISDLRFQDPVAVRSLLESGAIGVRFEDVSRGTVSAGIDRFQLPATTTAGEPLSGELAVFGSEGSEGRSATVEVREQGRLVFTQDVEIPGAGLLNRVPLTLPGPSSPGMTRYEARIRLAADAFPGDDARVAYVSTDPEEGLLVAISLLPDWELRFLLPLLEQSTGLIARGFVRVGPDLFMPTGGEGVGRPVNGVEVAGQLDAAELVVLQGVAGNEPAWLEAFLARAPRALLFPADARGASAIGVSTGAALPGEWTVSSTLPPSALAADLAGVVWQGLPPLESVLSIARDDPGDVPLRLQGSGTGVGEAALVLREGASGRSVAVLATGFWRWGFRAGPPREAYRRLWSGVAGWLLADEGIVAGPLLRPLVRVVPRGQRIQWVAPGAALDSIQLRITRGDDVILDSLVEVPAGGRLETAALTPGEYGYRATARGSSEREAVGRFDVEVFTQEFLPRPARDLVDVLPTVTLADALGSTRPLRTHPGPYLLLLGLLCGEWIARRRRGLR